MRRFLCDSFTCPARGWVDRQEKWLLVSCTYLRLPVVAALVPLLFAPLPFYQRRQMACQE